MPHARGTPQLHSEVIRFKRSQFVHGYRGRRRDEAELNVDCAMPSQWRRCHFYPATFKMAIDSHRLKKHHVLLGS